MRQDDGGVADTERRHSADCRAQEAQRQQDVVELLEAEVAQLRQELKEQEAIWTEVQRDDGVELLHHIRKVDELEAARDHLRAQLEQLVEKWRNEADRSRLLQGLDCVADLLAILRERPREENEDQKTDARVVTMGEGDTSRTASSASVGSVEPTTPDQTRHEPTANSTHTRKPWGWVYDGSSTYSIGAADDPQGTMIASLRDRNGARAVAHCNLIAAAPELLDALKYLLELGGDDDRRIAAEAAIARAEGRPYP